MGQVYGAGEGTTVGTFSVRRRGGGTGTRGLVLSWEGGNRSLGKEVGQGQASDLPLRPFRPAPPGLGGCSWALGEGDKEQGEGRPCQLRGWLEAGVSLFQKMH